MSRRDPGAGDDGVRPLWVLLFLAVTLAALYGTVAAVGGL